MTTKQKPRRRLAAAAAAVTLLAGACGGGDGDSAIAEVISAAEDDRDDEVSILVVIDAAAELNKAASNSEVSCSEARRQGDTIIDIARYEAHYDDWENSSLDAAGWEPSYAERVVEEDVNSAIRHACAG